MQQTGTLYLIPVPLADNALHTLAPEIGVITRQLSYYFAENARTARRFLRVLHPDLKIEPIIFSEIDKNTGPDIPLLLQWLREGKDIGVLSEAGCPGIADPGADLVAAAHNAAATVVPLTGPNSLILALMASGLNGQSFCFNGYLPVKEPERSKKIKVLETLSQKENQTQLFIETPYRNNRILEDLLRNCRDNTLLCVAQNITAPDASIRTQRIADWKRQKHSMEKTPTVFLLLAQ